MGEPGRRPTMRDVAEAAGVSFKTVSRVVNGEAGVSDELAQRVSRAVEALGYVPDERARNLRLTGNRPTSIGFVLVDVANPFFSAILRGLEDVARTRDCLVLSASSDGDPERQDRLIETFISRRVAGIVVVPAGAHAGVLDDGVLHDIPVVFLDCEPRRHQRDIVRSDHRGGAEAMTRHLIAHGHRDIAFLGDDPTTFSAALRLEGFRSAMAEAGLTVRDEWVMTGRHEPGQWQERVTSWWTSQQQRPTGLLTAQNFVTLGAVRALHALGIAGSVALVGFDDVEMSDVVQPGISVLPQQPAELGRRAGELLFGRIDGGRGRPVREIMTTAVIPRGSGELRPARTPRRAR